MKTRRGADVAVRAEKGHLIAPDESRDDGRLR